MQKRNNNQLLWEVYLAYPQTVSNTNIGFNDPKDPQKQNPLSGHELNEYVNRLARVDKDKPSLIPEEKDSIVKVADGTSWNEPDSAYDFYPYNHVYESESHIKEFDDSVGTERIHEYHRRGTFLRNKNTGDKSTRVIRDNYEVNKR